MSKRVGTLARTLKRAREAGLHAGVCENKIMRPGRFPVSRDLFGLFDAIFIAGSIVGVQSTSAGCLSQHTRKYRDDPELKSIIIEWLVAGGGFIVVYWRKDKKINRWIPKVHEYSLADGELVETKMTWERWLEGMGVE